MKKDGQIIILGSGGSMGVPVIACTCDICASTNPRNKRTRPSALLRIDGKQILIDCGPDFRSQALSCGLTSLDGLILTHSHQDHVAGLDDLRIFFLRSKKPIPTLLSTPTLEDIKSRFSYMFRILDEPMQSVVARFDIQEINPLRGEVLFLGLPIRYFSYEQTGMQVTGFRFGDLAYVSDIKKFPDTIYGDLAGVKKLVISALKLTASPFHFSVDEAVDFSKRIGAEQTRLIHLAHELEYEKGNAYLPPNIQLSYDNMSLDFTWELP